MIYVDKQTGVSVHMFVKGLRTALIDLFNCYKYIIIIMICVIIISIINNVNLIMLTSTK